MVRGADMQRLGRSRVWRSGRREKRGHRNEPGSKGSLLCVLLEASTDAASRGAGGWQQMLEWSSATRDSRCLWMGRPAWHGQPWKVGLLCCQNVITELGRAGASEYRCADTLRGVSLQRAAEKGDQQGHRALGQ